MVNPRQANSATNVETQRVPAARFIEPMFHNVGKVHTQTIERKHLTLRTRIK